MNNLLPIPKMPTPGAKFILLAFIALVAITGVPSAQAQQKSIITIGNANSPVLQQIKAKKAANAKKAAKTLLSAAKKNAKKTPGGDAKAQRKALKQALRDQMADVEAVLADLSTVEITDDEKLLVEAAGEANVPVVLEKVDKGKMSKLVGVGFDADVVVVETRPGDGLTKVNIWADLSSEGVPGEVEIGEKED